MAQPNLAPVPVGPFVDRDDTVSVAAQKWLQTVRQLLLPPQVRTTFTAGLSPYLYPDPGAAFPQQVLITGGTVSLIEYTGDGVSFDATGMITGMFYLPAQAQVRVTYTGAPTFVTLTTGTPL